MGFAVCVVGVLGILIGLFFYACSGGNWAVGCITGAVLPSAVILHWIVGSVKYLISTPADFTYNHDALLSGMGIRPGRDSVMQMKPSEDSIKEIVSALFEINNEAGAPPEEPRKVYPCSMAVPEKTWRNFADSRAKAYSQLAEKAKSCSPEQGVLLLTEAAVGLNRITMGMLYDASSYNRLAQPLLPQILSMLSRAENLPAIDRIRCLHEVASIASAQNKHGTAVEAYEKLLPLARTIIVDEVILASLLSNYARSARRCFKLPLARDFKSEANALWRKVPAETIERYMITGS